MNWAITTPARLVSSPARSQRTPIRNTGSTVLSPINRMANGGTLASAARWAASCVRSSVPNPASSWVPRSQVTAGSSRYSSRPARPAPSIRSRKRPWKNSKPLIQIRAMMNAGKKAIIAKLFVTASP